MADAAPATSGQTPVFEIDTQQLYPGVNYEDVLVGMGSVPPFRGY